MKFAVLSGHFRISALSISITIVSSIEAIVCRITEHTMYNLPSTTAGELVDYIIPSYRRR